MSPVIILINKGTHNGFFVLTLGSFRGAVYHIYLENRVFSGKKPVFKICPRVLRSVWPQIKKCISVTPIILGVKGGVFEVTFFDWRPFSPTLCSNRAQKPDSRWVKTGIRKKKFQIRIPDQIWQLSPIGPF